MAETSPKELEKAASCNPKSQEGSPEVVSAVPDSLRASAEEVEAIEKHYWQRTFHDIIRDWRLYVMLLPLLFFLVCWKYLPISSMVVAFKYFTGTGTIESALYIGFNSFKYLFSTAEFWSAFRNTFALSFYGLIFGFPFPIILALFFSEIKNKVFLSVSQVFTYMPKFISLVVVTNLIGMLLQGASDYTPAGPLAALLQAINPDWDNLLSDPKAFRSIYIISGIWETAGYSSIVYFAAVLGISPTNYEAARIDGANKWQQIKYVTIPGMAPTLVIMLILRLGELLSIGYEKVYLLQQQGVMGSTYETSQTIATFVINVYLNGEAGVNQGIGAAADLFNSFLSMFLVLGSNQIARKVSNTSLF
jgi:putative aldouronate transport system permease protein